MNKKTNLMKGEYKAEVCSKDCALEATHSHFVKGKQKFVHFTSFPKFPKFSKEHYHWEVLCRWLIEPKQNSVKNRRNLLLLEFLEKQGVDVNG